MFENVMVINGNSKKAIATKELLKNVNNDGRFGKAVELAFKTASNNKVAGKGEIDKKMAMVENGKKVFKSVEIKTNGGRIDDIARNDFIIYVMDICNSTTKGKRRTTEPVIMKTETFLQILENCGAIKKVNKQGLLDGYAIQVSNKAFYETMRDFPVKYINGKIYQVNEIY